MKQVTLSLPLQPPDPNELPFMHPEADVSQDATGQALYVKRYLFFDLVIGLGLAA